MSSVTSLAVLVFAIVVASLASPLPQQPQQITSFSVPGHSQVRDSSGQYGFSIQNHDGSQAQQQGHLALNSLGKLVLVQSGSFSLPRPDGSYDRISYLADENGYQPQGQSIPVQQPAFPSTF